MHKIKKKILNEYKMIKISPNIYKPNGIEILLDQNSQISSVSEREVR